MIEFIKYIILLVIILWFCMECYAIFKIINTNHGEVCYGKAICVEKLGGRVTSELKIELIDSKQETLNIKADFFSNLRWWLQPIPKIGDTVYFYKLGKETEVPNSLFTLAYGICVNKKCSNAKRFADLYYYYSVNYLLLFAFVLLALFALFFLFGSRTKDVITIFSAVYLILRMVLKSFLF
jgi:hypothetical protein